MENTKRDNIVIDGKTFEVIDDEKIDDYYENSGIASSIIQKMKNNLRNMKAILYKAPSFVETVKTIVPRDAYDLVLSTDQKEKLASGSLQLMKSGDDLIATLIDPKTKKIVSHINLKKIRINPEFSKELNNYLHQSQLMEIANKIEYVQLAVEEVRQGQENDRLAIAYSCKQKLLQSLAIKDNNIKTMALINLISSSEDARNALMLSQSSNLEIIKKQLDDFIERFLNGKDDKEIDKRMNEIRENLNSVNILSLIETVAYQELGEEYSAKICMEYYGDYIKKTYLDSPNLVARLDSIDPSPKQYWSKMLPSICEKVNALTQDSDKDLLEDKKDE